MTTQGGNEGQRETREQRMSLRRGPMKRPRRRGAHTVEFALALPILLLVVYGAIELTRINMMRNTALNAAYEGARRGALPGAAAADAEAAAKKIIDVIGATGVSIAVSPTTITPQTSRVTVTVSIPLDRNAWIVPYFAQGRNLIAECTLACELASR